MLVLSISIIIGIIIALVLVVGFLIYQFLDTFEDYIGEIQRFRYLSKPIKEVVK